MEKLTGLKKPGNILSAFKTDINDVLPDKYKIIKKELVQRCGENELQASWIRLTEEFDKEIQLIKEKGSAIIPQIEFSAILENNGKFPSSVADEIRKRGCVVIRNVLDRAEALKYKQDVKQYINNHKGKIAGFPGMNFRLSIRKRNPCTHSPIYFFRRQSSGLGDLLVESKTFKMCLYSVHLWLLIKLNHYNRLR